MRFTNFEPSPNLRSVPALKSITPSISWKISGNKAHLKRYNGSINSGAYMVIREIAKEKGITGKVGVMILIGRDEDAGSFALRVMAYEGRSPYIAALSTGLEKSRGALFSCGALARIQVSGFSQLERDGDCLVGKLGVLKRTSKKRGPRSEL